MIHFDGKTYDCPFDCFLAVLKGKWRTDLLRLFLPIPAISGNSSGPFPESAPRS